MQKDQLPYDTAFAYEYIWHQQDEDLPIAVQIIEIIVDDAHDAANCPCAERRAETVLKLLASNPNCPTEVLAHIANCSRSSEVLERIAGNPNTDTRTLQFLALSPSTQVRAAVADNLNADARTLRMLLEDGSTDVRFMLAENPNLPEEILSELAEDDNPYVAYRAQITRARAGQVGSELSQMPRQQKRQIRRAV